MHTAGATLALPSAAAAGDVFFDDIPIVLTASRLAQSPIDAPAAVTIIDREMIAASGFTEIHDLLRLVPGFLVAQWPEGSPTVANHGLGDAYNGRVKVMIDGRTVNSPMRGNANWRELPVRTDDIERIEVVRGPNGAAYGANAFQGVVNIITRAPATEDGLTLISRIGQDGFYDHGVRLSGQPDGAVDWRLSGSRRAARTFRSPAENDGMANPQERFVLDTVNFSASTQLSPNDELRLQLGMSDGVHERGTPGSVADPIGEESFRANYLHLAWTRSFGAESDFTLQYYRQSEHVRPGKLAVAELGGRRTRLAVVDVDLDTTRDDLELQYSTRLDPAWQMMIGAGVRQESVRSRDYFNTRGTLYARHAQVFGSLTWQPVEWLKINAGGTFEKHDYSGDLFSPRLAFNIALSQQSSLRLSGGVAYRAPTLLQSDAEQVYREDGAIKALGLRATQRLQPERVRYAELGYVALLADLGLNLDVRVFHESYERYIDERTCWNPAIAADGTVTPLDPNNPLGRLPCRALPPSGYLPYEQTRPQRSSEMLNSGAFVMDGAEFSVDWRRPGWGRVVLSQAFIEIDAGKGVLDEDIEVSAPQAVTSLLLIKELPDRWRASIGYYHNEKMKWLNQGDVVPPRDRVDLKVSRSFGPARSDNEFAITAQSVGGRYPEFHEGKYRAEPQLFASLRLSW
ncbi:TonB-dependent receptor plug domain-containing protein [Thauera sinica]|uniref:TonB-dependent receptor plug domain-containing protein n=1 Tax=Thauera sinica TaxID=2665146 RepID=A0ABW1APK0_9RHOO|nr:TonB-dependent receptor [Thauera sp. K11]ATE62223.1 TonB-dependent receptor [Thauera sp. K11]